MAFMVALRESRLGACDTWSAMKTAATIEVTVPENRKLELELPPEVPAGKAKLELEPEYPALEDEDVRQALALRIGVPRPDSPDSGGLLKPEPGKCMLPVWVALGARSSAAPVVSTRAPRASRQAWPSSSSSPSTVAT